MDSNSNDLKQLFDQEKTKYQQATDKLGHGIEAGILDIVVVLNLLNIPTSQSCEGHLDRGLAGPWVQIAGADNLEIKGAQEEMLQFLKTADQIKATDSKNFLTNQDYINTMNNFRDKQNILQKYFQNNCQKLIDYLNEFYEDYTSNFDTKLIINRLDSAVPTLISQGVYLQNIRSEEKQEYLNKYRQEMDYFKDFLIKKYFNQTKI